MISSQLTRQNAHEQARGDGGMMNSLLNDNMYIYIAISFTSFSFMKGH